MKKTFKIDIPVINLDVEERIEEVQKQAQQEVNEEIAGDKRWAEMILKGLVKDCENERAESHKEFYKRRIQVLMEALMIEIVEEEEK